MCPAFVSIDVVCKGKYFFIISIVILDGDLNFDAWPVFDMELRELHLRDIEQQLVKGEMPPGYYKLTHAGARLTGDEVAALLAWARDR